jgi:CHAD domain-containing protein
VSRLLTRPPEEAARLVALELLARCREGAARLGDPADVEALHDFRVGVRRLRSVLAAYRDPLRGSVRKRHRRALGSLADATGEGRDAEVALAWVGRQGEHVSAEERPGVEWMARRLEARRGSGYETAREALGEDYAPLAEELGEALSVYSRRVRLGDDPGRSTFGELLGDTATRDLERLVERLTALDAGTANRQAHRARLTAKRLRYLLEPLGEELAAVRPILTWLKALQDLLGSLNDAHVLDRELARAVDLASRERGRALLAGVLAEAAGRPAAAPAGEEAAAQGVAGIDPVPGLLALARGNRRRRDDLFARLVTEWTGAEAAERQALEREVGSLVGWLARGFTPPPPAAAGSAPAPAP